MAMTQDLEQIDRNHAVRFSYFALFFLFCYFLHSGELSSGGCAQAHPLGVVPEIRADCLQSVRIFITLISIRAFLK